MKILLRGAALDSSPGQLIFAVKLLSASACHVNHCVQWYSSVRSFLSSDDG